MKPLTILLTNSHSGLQTGSGMQVYFLARELVKRGHSVTAAFKKNAENDDIPHPTLNKLIDAGVDLIRVPFAKLKYSYTIPTLIEFGDYLWDQNFDVVHAFSGKDLNYLFILSWFVPMPVLISNRGTAARLDVFNSIKYRFSRVTRIIATSEAVKEVLIDSGGISRDKIDVVHSAVDLAEFDPGLDGTSVREELGIPLDAPVVGVIGSLRFKPGHIKGGMELLAAARIMIERDPRTRFLIVGAVNRDRFYKAVDPAIAHNFVFTGFREDVPRMMAACDVVASPSTRIEALAGVLREALAMKKPVVGTDIGGNRELVIPDRTGLLVPPRDPEALAGAVLSLIEDPEKGRAMAEEGRKRVERYFALTGRIDRIERAYYRALENAPASPRPGRFKLAFHEGVKSMLLRAPARHYLAVKQQ